MTTTYTSSLRLAKPDFRSGPWGSLINANADAIDAAITNALAAANITVWDNSTAYTIGDIAMDDTASPPTFWICATAHTSAASPTTFETDRAAHATYWTSLTFGITPRGEWANDTDYGYYDIAYDSTQGIVGLCLIAHTSSASPATIDDDVANWVFIVDLPSVGTTPATNVSFDNTTAALAGSPANVQAAIDALDTRVDNAATTVSGVISDVATHETRLDTFDTSVAANTSSIASHETRIDTLESDMTNAEARLDGHDADIAALGAGFAAGTKMIFFQTAAPTGWTKDTTHHDKAMRVVTGTSGGSSGGTSVFSTVFGKTTTDATTLTTSTIPSHTHSYDDYSWSDTASGGGTPGLATGSSQLNQAATGRTSGAAGTGGSHTHPMDIRVQYIDVIVCSKS